ncbi:MAG: hypothetical protein ACYDCL_21545 [Myxococcales bacterium]
MAQNFQQLVFEARRLVAYTNRDFAKLTGVSLRTVERYNRNFGISHSGQTHKLIAAVYPKNAELARQLAVASGTSLEALGLVPPAPAVSAAPPAPPAPPPPAPVPEARSEHADAVLLAAAHAMNLPPEAVRPAVAAALARARDLGVSVAGLAERLSQPLPRPPLEKG